jgi:hypothetical protein
LKFCLLFNYKKNTDFIIIEFSLGVCYKEGSLNTHTPINFGLSSSCFLDLVFWYGVTSPHFTNILDSNKIYLHWNQNKNVLFYTFKLACTTVFHGVSWTKHLITISPNNLKTLGQDLLNRKLITSEIRYCFLVIILSQIMIEKTTSYGLMMKGIMFWNVMLCLLMFWKNAKWVEELLLVWLTLLSWRWRQYVPLKDKLLLDYMA